MAALAGSTDLKPSDIRLKLALAYSLAELGIAVPAPSRRLAAGSRRLRARSVDRPARVGTAARGKATAVFGVPLIKVVAAHGVAFGQLQVPAIIGTLRDTLAPHYGTEGLFRVSANSATLRELKAQVDHQGSDGLDGDPHNLAGLLKLYLRELPDPLLTERLYESFIAAGRIEDPRQQLMAVRLLVLELPTAHLHTLVALCSMLDAAAKAPGNKMHAATLATVMAPNLLKPPSKPRKRNSKRGRKLEQAAIAAEFINHGNACKLVELLITHHDVLGSMPSHVLSMATKFSVKEASRLYPMVTQKTGRGGSWWWPFGGSRNDSTMPVPAMAMQRTKSERSPTRRSQKNREASRKNRVKSGSAIPDFIELGGGAAGMHALARDALLSAPASPSTTPGSTPAASPPPPPLTRPSQDSGSDPFGSPEPAGFGSGFSSPGAPGNPEIAVKRQSTLSDIGPGFSPGNPTGVDSNNDSRPGSVALTQEQKLRVNERGTAMVLPAGASDSEFEGFGFMDY